MPTPLARQHLLSRCQRVQVTVFPSQRLLPAAEQVKGECRSEYAHFQMS